MTNKLTIIEGGQLVILDNIVAPDSAIAESMVNATVSSIITDLNQLFPKSTFMHDGGIIVQQLCDDTILFFCGILRADQDSFTLKCADGFIDLDLSKSSLKTPVNTWLRLQRIVRQYRMLLDDPFKERVDENSIKHLLAS